jgi:hypothetical protein
MTPLSPCLAPAPPPLSPEQIEQWRQENKADITTLVVQLDDAIRDLTALRATIALRASINRLHKAKIADTTGAIAGKIGRMRAIALGADWLKKYLSSDT